MAKDIKELRKELNKFIEEIIDKEMLQSFADKMKDTIYKRTKSGKGVSSDKSELGAGSLKQLKELSKSYKEYRKKVPLGDYASANKSNLTLTGQMLDSITAKVVGKDAVVEIPASSRSDGQNNKQVANKVTEAGRPFFNLADSELKQFEAFVSRELRKKIRDLNK